MSVAYIGDLDGDGVSEFCLTAMDYAARNFAFRDSTTTSATIRSGSSGATLREIYRSNSASEACEAAVALGDVDGDGAGDVALLINGRGTNGRDMARRLLNVSGGSGERISAIHLDGGALHPGQFASIADLDGDGARDFLIATGRLYASEQDDLFVLVRSGRTGAVIRTHQVPDEAFGCRYLRVLGDVTGDGTEDYAIAWAQPGEGWTPGVAGSSVFDGLTGAELRWHDGACVHRALREPLRGARAYAYALSWPANAAEVGWSLVDGRDGTVLETHSAGGFHRVSECLSCDFQRQSEQFEVETGIETKMPRIGEPNLLAFSALELEQGRLVCVQHLGSGPLPSSSSWNASAHWTPRQKSESSEVPPLVQSVLDLEGVHLLHPESPDGSAVPRFALTKIDEQGATLWIEREGRVVKFADV